jgi:hypothetical protein
LGARELARAARPILSRQTGQHPALKPDFRPGNTIVHYQRYPARTGKPKAQA